MGRPFKVDAAEVDGFDTVIGLVAINAQGMTREQLVAAIKAVTIGASVFTKLKKELGDPLRPMDYEEVA